MMKQVYIADLKSAGASHPGSIPGTRTNFALDSGPRHQKILARVLIFAK